MITIEQHNDIFSKLDAMFRLDLWFSCYLGLMDHSVPVRKYDWDFNENYESDRRFMTSYASSLAFAREELLEVSKRLGYRFTTNLDFDPMLNLRGTSPLDSFRNEIFKAYRELLLIINPNNYQDIKNTSIEFIEKKCLSYQNENIYEEFRLSLNHCLNNPQDLGNSIDLCIESIITNDKESASTDRSKAGRLLAGLRSLLNHSKESKPDLLLTRLWALKCAMSLSAVKEKKQKASSSQIYFAIYCRLLRTQYNL